MTITNLNENYRFDIDPYSKRFIHIYFNIEMKTLFYDKKFHLHMIHDKNNRRFIQKFKLENG